MALSGRVVRSTCSALVRPRLAVTGAAGRAQYRSLTSLVRPHLQLSQKTVAAKHQQQTRKLSKSARLGVASQEAPNAQAYLNSGAIAGARDLVDVKKVLVIGSGGLSIGQAGEFDYSGNWRFSFGGCDESRRARGWGRASDAIGVIAFC
jgi:carbamoyl-phosphate synthase large subunit